MSVKRSYFEVYRWHLEVPLFTAVSLALLVQGLREPVLYVSKLWQKNTFSILSGISQLHQDGHHFLGHLIFFFSIIFPVTKLVMLLIVWFLRLDDRWRRSILYALEVLGRWSMLDVFVASVIIVAIKLGPLASAQPRRGLYIFCAAILCSMLTTLWADILARGTAARD